ncbi:MAG TPA: extracellular solute-binding protein, partial [Beutenbergiaceae bacterium]|nr:extracellular solute-binding protein [Beutenbergiaceae bacterium]
MRQRNRTTSSIVAGSATALLLAGCFAGNVNDEADDIDVSRDLTDEDITLTLTYIDEPPTGALIEAFEEEHPNITIDTTQIPFTDYVKSIQRAMDSPSAPDMVQFNPGAMRSLIPAGLVRDLTPYQEEYGWDEIFPASTLETFHASDDAKEFNTGSLYATPGALSVLGVFYNKDLLDEAGISSLPETIDEFEQTLGELDDHDIQPFIVGGLEIGAFQ